MNNQVVPAGGFAGMQRHCLYDAVAFVEYPKHCNPLRHRSDAGGVFRWSCGLLGRLLLRLLVLVAASRERQGRDTEQ